LTLPQVAGLSILGYGPSSLRNYAEAFASLGKIEASELLVILFSCHIVGTGGVDFGGETAEANAFSIGADSSSPFADLLVERYADVTRVSFFLSFSPVEHIL